MRRAAFPWRDGHPVHLPVASTPAIVLLPGDPARVDKAGAVLEDFRILGQNREFRFGEGRWAGQRIGVCSTGIGGPSTEIAMVELANIGMQVAVRIGGTGAIEPGRALGELVIARDALRLSGAASHYSDGSSHIAASAALVSAARETCEAMKIKHSVGTVATVDGYYAAQGRPLRPDGAGTAEVERLASVGACCIDMETETVLSVGAAMNIHAGAVLAVHANRVHDSWLEDYEHAQMAVIRVGAAAGMAVLRQIQSPHP